MVVEPLLPSFACIQAISDSYLEPVSDVSTNDSSKLLIKGCRKDRVLVDGLHQIWRPIGKHDICDWDVSCT